MGRIVVIGGAVLSMAGMAAATPVTYDLTAADSNATVNGAVYLQGEAQPTGSGVISSFLRIQAKPTEQGYNTAASHQVPFDDKSGISFNNGDVSVDDLASSQTLINGVPYYTLLLDVNQQGNGGNGLITLDRLQVYTSPVHNQYTQSFAANGDLSFPSGATKVYDLDGPGSTDNSILLDYGTNGGGSGKGDMFAYIPVSDFAGARPTDAFYLYTQLGTGNQSNAGFEEWAFVSVPEPASLSVIGLGLGLLVRRRRAI